MYPTQPPGMPDDEWNALAAINHDHGEEYPGQYDHERALLRERGYDSFEYPQLYPFEPRPEYASAPARERLHEIERRVALRLNEHPHAAWVQLTAADIDQIAEMATLTAFQTQNKTKNDMNALEQVKEVLTKLGIPFSEVKYMGGEKGHFTHFSVVFDADGKVVAK
jgi:hypothetical protein